MKEPLFPFSAKGPQFEEHVTQAIRRAKRRRLYFILLLSLIIAAVVGFFVLDNVKNSKEKKIAGEYASLMDVFRQEESAAENSKQPVTMDSKSVLPQSSDLHSKSREQMKAFVMSHLNHPLAWHVAIVYAGDLVKINKSQEAIEPLEKILPFIKKNDVLETKTRLILAGIFMNLNRYPDALSQLDSSILLPGNPDKELSMLLKARVFVFQGKPKESAEVLQRIIQQEVDGANNPQIRAERIHEAKVLLSLVSPS